MAIIALLIWQSNRKDGKLKNLTFGLFKQNSTFVFALRAKIPSAAIPQHPFLEVRWLSHIKDVMLHKK